MTLVSSPIFVVGSGRSGTTLMRSLLSAHPRLSIAPETHYVKRALADGDGRAVPLDFDAFWHRYSSSVRFQDLGVDPERCLALLDGHEPTYRDVFAAMLGAYRARSGKPRVGEKTPSHVRHLDTLLDWFPDARVVVMRRDPRAIVASKLRNPWVTRRITPPSVRGGLLVGSRLYELLYAAQDWVELYEQIVPAWAGDPRVQVVDYEALVIGPEAEMRRVCEGVGEAFDPAMLHRRSRETVAMPAGEVPDERLEAWKHEHQARTLEPVSADSLEKWRGQLSAAEVALVEGHCRRGMRRFGYAFSAAETDRLVGRMAAALLLRLGHAEKRLRAAGAGLLHLSEGRR